VLAREMLYTVARGLEDVFLGSLSTPGLSFWAKRQL
jgi:hypothetical protein